MKYAFEIHDGEEWMPGDGGFATALEAKKAGVDAGFEYVRVVEEKPAPDGEGRKQCKYCKQDTEKHWVYCPNCGGQEREAAHAAQPDKEKS